MQNIKKKKLKDSLKNTNAMIYSILRNSKISRMLFPAKKKLKLGEEKKKRNS